MEDDWESGMRKMGEEWDRGWRPVPEGQKKGGEDRRGVRQERGIRIHLTTTGKVKPYFSNSLQNNLPISKTFCCSNCSFLLFLDTEERVRNEMYCMNGSSYRQVLLFHETEVNHFVKTLFHSKVPQPSLCSHMGKVFYTGQLHRILRSVTKVLCGECSTQI